MKLIFLLSIFLFLSSLTFLNATPTAPEAVFPENGATAVYSEIYSLQWKISTGVDGDIVHYDLYFGDSPNPPLYRNNLYDFWFSEVNTQFASMLNDTTLEFYNGSGLVVPETTYYWRIVAKDSQGGQTPFSCK